MRISDWSSDVCSSDLPRRSWCGISLALRHIIANAGKPLIEHALHIGLRDRRCRNERIALRRNRRRKKNGANHSRQGQSRGRSDEHLGIPPLRKVSMLVDGGKLPDWQAVIFIPQDVSVFFWIDSTRSEEHTSELQSLMRISYAVLCLK